MAPAVSSTIHQKKGDKMESQLELFSYGEYEENQDSKILYGSGWNISGPFCYPVEIYDPYLDKKKLLYMIKIYPYS